MARPRFQRMIKGSLCRIRGAVCCIAAPRLVRNGRDWHHLIDLCARTRVLVVDPEGVCDPRLTPRLTPRLMPRLMNDRLLPGLKRTELLPVSWTRR
jgi:hypothetical protein